MRQRDNISSDLKTLSPDKLDVFINGCDSFLRIKHDTSTTVGIIKGDLLGQPFDLLVKRFNYRGFPDLLLRGIAGSRARRLWRISHKLYEKGLPVPRPLACIESFPLQKTSFYLSASIDRADNLANLYLKNSFLRPEEIAQQLSLMIANWHLNGAVHGDLKWSNILVKENGSTYTFFLVDLDQSKLYHRPSLKGIRRDLRRFYRYALELGAESWADNAFIPAYRSALPDKINSSIDIERIKNEARKEWEEKGQRRL